MASLVSFLFKQMFRSVSALLSLDFFFIFLCFLVSKSGNLMILLSGWVARGNLCLMDDIFVLPYTFCFEFGIFITLGHWFKPSKFVFMYCGTAFEILFIRTCLPLYMHTQCCHHWHLEWWWCGRVGFVVRQRSRILSSLVGKFTNWLRFVSLQYFYSKVMVYILKLGSLNPSPSMIGKFR